MPATATLERQINERLRRGVGVSTPERVRQAGETALDVVAGVQRIAQSPLDRLYARGELSPDRGENKRLFDAGDRFREDAYLAGAIWPSPGLSYDAPQIASGASTRLPGFLRSETAADAMKRHVRASNAVPGALRQVAILICLGEERTTAEEIGYALNARGKRSATVAGMTAIRLALGALADHYFGSGRR